MSSSGGLFVWLSSLVFLEHAGWVGWDFFCHFFSFQECFAFPIVSIINFSQRTFFSSQFNLEHVYVAEF